MAECQNFSCKCHSLITVCCGMSLQGFYHYVISRSCIHLTVTQKIQQFTEYNCKHIEPSIEIYILMIQQICSFFSSGNTNDHRSKVNPYVLSSYFHSRKVKVLTQNLFHSNHIYFFLSVYHVHNNPC